MNKQVIILVLVVSLVFLGIGVVIGSRNSASSTPSSSQANTNLLKIDEQDWIKGNKNAPVTLVEYGDFQCPSCGAYYPLLKQLLNDNPDKLRVVFRNFPLTRIHKNAFMAAKAAEAAGNQGKFWEMHDLLFESQSEWENSDNFKQDLKGKAQRVGLDVNKFMADLDSVGLDEKVQQDVLSGNSLNVDSTPTFFINGQKIDKLPGSYEALKKLIDGEAVKVTPEVKSDEVHEHMDVIIAVNGVKQDLSQDKYMEKNEGIHFHDKYGEVVHKHKLGVTLKDLVDSLKLTDLPVTLVKVNKKKVNDWEKYNPQDLDRILVSFGSATENQIQNLEQKLTDKACIYSEKCPERGKPPTEKCVGGLGTDCK